VVRIDFLRPAEASVDKKLHVLLPSEFIAEK